MTSIATTLPVADPPEDALTDMIGTTLLKEGEALSLLDTQVASASYVGLYFSASYCPSCKDFNSLLENSFSRSLRDKGLQIVLVSNDRSEDAFNSYVDKFPSFFAIPYSPLQQLKGELRERWGIKTMPALVVLERATGAVCTAAGRDGVAVDPSGEHFPWADPKTAPKLGDYKKSVVIEVQERADSAAGKAQAHGWGRFMSSPLLVLGHHVNGSKQMYMDEHAVRARAGLLNLLSWFALLNVYFLREQTLLWVLWPIVSWDFMAAALWGLTPLSPFGVLGTLMSMLIHPKPYWKPAAPKRFAWVIGFVLVNSCFGFHNLGWYSAVKVSITMCCIFTWMESSLGFCVGCFVYNNMVVPIMGAEKCEECQL